MLSTVNKLTAHIYHNKRLVILVYIHVYSFLVLLALGILTIVFGFLGTKQDNLALLALFKALATTSLLVIAVCFVSIGFRALITGELAIRSKDSKALFAKPSTAKVIGLILISLSLIAVAATRLI